MSPDDLKQEAQQPMPDTSRRRFFWQVWLAIGGLAALEYVWMAIDFLRPRGSGIEAGANVIVAGPVKRFEPSTVTPFPWGKFYLSRLEDGGFLALSRECTHLGCIVPWDDDEGRFICPCHASAYDEKGEVLNPPAPRPLDTYPVRIENGIVLVDIEEPIKRNRYDRDQVTRR
jgi:cytochrome b6-f complex iron-sulfur subunit